MCAICDGATEDEVRQHLADSIDWYGWAIQGVEASPENWGWAYTVGLTERFHHPELVVASPLGYGAHHGLLNLLAEQIQAGRRLAPDVRATLEDAELAFAAVHPRQFGHGVFNMWFDHYRAFAFDDAGPRLSALQVVLPSRYFTSHTGPQPRLDRPENALSRRGGNRSAHGPGSGRGGAGARLPGLTDLAGLRRSPGGRPDLGPATAAVPTRAYGAATR